MNLLEVVNFVDNEAKKYFLESKSIETGKDTWNILEVNILDHEKNKVGSYSRNYSDLYRTFFPFVKDGKEYALYSNHYMYTRVMELSNCKDLGGEDKSNVDYENHFCPIEFYVPTYRSFKFDFNGKEEQDWLKGDECLDKDYEKLKLSPIKYCNFGFVAGCFWGDDSSCKIQFLYLSEVEKGIIKRDERFGYLEMPSKMELKDAIDMSRWEPNHNWVGISNTVWKEFQIANR